MYPTDQSVGYTFIPGVLLLKSSAYVVLEHVTSCSTGHEVKENAHHPSYAVARNMKLKDQEQDAAKHAPGGKTATLFGAKIYCDGYLEGATDTEVKKLVATHGGIPMFEISTLLYRQRES